MANRKGGVWLYGRSRRVDPRWRRDYLRAIGANVKRARLERSIAIAELAAATGMHQASIRRIEDGGRADTGVWTICRLALAMSLSPSELLP